MSGIDELKEQAVVGGVLCTRVDEDQPWVPLTPQELTEIVLELRKRLAVSPFVRSPAPEQFREVVRMQYVHVPVHQEPHQPSSPYVPGTIIC
jgi:hypothetical protein